MKPRFTIQLTVLCNILTIICAAQDAEVPGLKKLVIYKHTGTDSSLKAKSVITELYDSKGMLTTYEEHANGDTVEYRVHKYNEKNKPIQSNLYEKSFEINNAQKLEINTTRTSVSYKYDSWGNEIEVSSTYTDFVNYKTDAISEYILKTNIVYGKNDSAISIIKTDNQHDFATYHETNTYGAFGVTFKKVITKNSDVTDSTFSTYTYDVKGKLTKIKVIYYGWDGYKSESLYSRDKNDIISFFKRTYFDEKQMKLSVEFLTNGRSDSTWYYKRNKIDRKEIAKKIIIDTLPPISFFGGNKYFRIIGRKVKFDSQGRLIAFYANHDPIGKMHIYEYNEKNLVKRRTTSVVSWHEGEPMPKGKPDEVMDYEYEFY